MSQQRSISSFFKPVVQVKKEPSDSDAGRGIQRLKSSSSVVSQDDLKIQNDKEKDIANAKANEKQVKEISLKMSRFKYDKKNSAPSDLDGSDYLESSEKQLLHQKFAKKLKDASMFDRKRLRENDAVDEEGNDDDEYDDGENTVRRKSATLKKKKTTKLTPLEAQIMELKKQNRDKILAINVGYKYKFYGPDARIVAQILNIMMIPGKESLDGENPNDALYDKLAYCSIPEPRLHIHLKRLLIRGLKVGVVEQTETAAIKSLGLTRNSLFERKLENVYTSATYIEDEHEDVLFGTKGGDCIAAVVETCHEDEGSDGDNLVEISLVTVNPLSGEIVYDTFTDDYLRGELDTRLYHLQPSEYVVFNATSEKTMKKIMYFEKTNHKVRIIKVERSASQSDDFYTTDLMDYCQNSIKNETKRAEMIDFLNLLPANAQICCLLLINYLKEFKLDNSFQLKSNYDVFTRINCMILNANTLSSLEVFENSTTNTQEGTLIEILDHTKTVFGYRLLKKWVSKPLVNRDQIEERLEAIANIKDNIANNFFEGLSNVLNGLPDLEKYLSRIHYQKSKRKEIYQFLKHLDTITTTCLNNSIDKAFLNLKSPLLKETIQTLAETSKETQSTVRQLLLTIDVQAAMDSKDKPKQVCCFFNSKSEYFEDIELENDKIRDIEVALQDELKRIKKFLHKPYMEYKTISKEEYLIEVSRSMLKAIPKDWVKVSDTKTLIRYRSPQIVELQKQLNYQKAVLMNVCEKLFFQFLEKVDEDYLSFHQLIKQLAKLDCLFSITAASVHANEYTRPQFVDQKIISVKEGRNPIIENLLQDSYIPNDIDMRHQRNRALILTGPNMGGKSSYVRQIALIVIMAQIGCYVPASSAVLGVFDSIFTRMGFNDDILKGESTFMVEMNQCCNIIRNCTSNSLVILDEVGRGTGTTDGISIAYAILDYLLTNEEKLPLTLFITHYTELCGIAKEYPDLVKNLHMDFTEIKEDDKQKIGTVTFLYKVVEGYSQNSYGLNVAKICTIPDNVIDEAYEISKNFEKRDVDSKNISWALEAREGIRSLLIDNMEDHDANVEEHLKKLEIIASE